MDKGKNFLSGVPMASIKHAKFLTKAGAFYTMAKIIYNNKVYETSKTAENGAVLFDGDYTNWVFVAPDGKLDFDGMNTMSLLDALTYIADAETAVSIPAWDEFCVWIGTLKDEMNQIFENANRCLLASVNTENVTEINAPHFDAFADFAGFVGAIITACEPAADAMADDFRTAEKAYSFYLTFTALDKEGNEKNELTMMMTFRE